MTTIQAPAKINLTLEILGRRTDGFHELRSVMQAIDLADELQVELSDQLTLECDDPSLAGSDNLVLMAARALRSAAGVSLGAALTLTKRIPVAAGLGGGSSDAAAALVALNSLWRIDWSRVRLAKVAAGLGSDVPFFLWSGTALVEGRGERVRALPPLPAVWFVLAVAGEPGPEKTRTIFQAVSREDFGDGSIADGFIADLRQGCFDPARMRNGLEPAADRTFSALASARAAFALVGASPAVLSGAGPSLFAASPDYQEAVRWKDGLTSLGLPAYIARPVPPR